VTVARQLPTSEARELIQLAADVADKVRYMREAKFTQIFEGTNQIQRLVIGRSLSSAGGRA
jgi:alkylation response protein AidB-like acyl-CoA dehydrogenase